MRAWLALASMLVVACGKKGAEADAGASASPGASGSASVSVDAGASVSVSVSADAGASASADAAAAGPCPEDMAFVETSFCPDVERHCLDMEHEETNHLEICHAFAHEQRCRTEERKLAACIDRYEYPNKKGAHPVWMLDWSQAQATCESKGKRLCTGNEWTAACEGPDHVPFPYGWERDHDK